MRLRDIPALLILLLVAAPATVFSENWESVYEKNDLSLSASASFLLPLGVALYPGAELILLQFTIVDEIPLDFGVSLRGQFGLKTEGTVTVSGAEYGYTTYGGGAFGTLHLSFANMEGYELDFLEGFDFYISASIALNYFDYTGVWPSAVPPAISPGFASFEGINWFISESLALKLEYVYWGIIGSSATLGVQLTF